MNKKAKIDGKIINIVDWDTYNKFGNELDNNYNGIQVNNCILPLRGKNDLRPGIYNDGNNVFYRLKFPDKTDMEDYSPKNIIDFDNASNIKEIIEKQNKLKSMENSILTTADNIFIPQVDPNDSSEMIALKKAVIAKHIDLDKYEQRFGSNYNNDRRLFNKNSITLVKLKSIADALDMKVSLSIEDKDEDVPNPIGSKITVDITGGEE